MLDTSVIISPPVEGLASIADLVAVSAISIAELEYRIGAAADAMQRQRRRRRLEIVTDSLEVIPLDRVLHVIGVR